MKHHISAVAQLIADPTRAGILSTLMDGRAHTAGEIARYLNVSAQVMSNHLKKLSVAKMITKLKSGRHHYYCLAGEEIACILESLCIALDDNIYQERIESTPKEICNIRSCYKHMAGKLGIKIMASLKMEEHVCLANDSICLTDKGYDFFLTKGILKKNNLKNFSPMRHCLDWTERKYHLAGGAADLLLSHMLEEHFLKRSKNIPRALIMTQKGREWLESSFKISSV